MRRAAVLVAVSLVAAALAAFAGSLPASGQSAPTLTVDTFRTQRPGGCANPGDNFDLVIGGATNQGTVSVVLFSPSGNAINKASAASSSGRWQTSLVWSYSQTGTYEVRSSASTATVSAYLEVPCQTPTLTYAPTCFTPGVATRVAMTANHFPPFGTGYLYYDLNGSEAQTAIRLPVDGHGVVSHTFSVTPSNRDHPGEANNAQQGGPVADATWSPCPPGTVPTTIPPTTEPTATTAPPDQTTLPPETIPTPTTRPGATTTTIIATTTTLLIPPPTAGATLVCSPPLGTPGFVTTATGTGFPPNAPVDLRWLPGLGTTTVTTAADGTFTASVLIFPKDRLGPRTLAATSGAVTATAPFLVVPNSVHPSGKDVTQINRLRRFTQR